MNIFYVLLLGFAVSIDGFIAGIAYGLKNIKIPASSLGIVGLVTVLCTGSAMFFASMLEQYINPHVAIVCGSLLLIAIGIVSLFQEYLTKNIKDFDFDDDITARKLTISIGRIMINILAKPETADVDNSKKISSTEAILLGLALGIDNMVATFAASLMGFLPLYTPLLMGVIQIAVVSAGILASTRIVSESLKKRFPYLPGTLLILLGLSRLS
ncbi:putative membrane protein YtaF [Sporomusaceae bacterium FL31]|nr:putative membrane protein YtaF [Sporomusaceae bacterium FL31]GCE34765.1 putative membrane protein YtaF [Sporomusaceae bacterium]